jgi:hypothetical protein
MELIEIKSLLHRKIEMINNEELLLEVLSLLELETKLKELIIPDEISNKIESAKLERTFY